MQWARQQPDPLRSHRLKLAEQERALNEQMARLSAELEEAGRPASPPVQNSEPPVWRLDDDVPTLMPETPARRKALARQRGRDRIIFFIFVIVLFVAFAIWLWVYNTHASGTTGGV